jgi:hypothetical protein
MVNACYLLQALKENIENPKWFKPEGKTTYTYLNKSSSMVCTLVDSLFP